MNRLKTPLLCLLAALVIDAGGILADKVFHADLSLILFLWGLSTLPIACLLYWLRRSHRLYYGAFELLVAVGVLYFLLLGMVLGDQSKALSAALLVNRILTIFAVTYFMVRAIDNIGEGITQRTPLEARWNAIFPKPTK